MFSPRHEVFHHHINIYLSCGAGNGDDCQRSHASKTKLSCRESVITRKLVVTRKKYVTLVINQRMLYQFSQRQLLYHDLRVKKFKGVPTGPKRHRILKSNDKGPRSNDFPSTNFSPPVYLENLWVDCRVLFRPTLSQSDFFSGGKFAILLKMKVPRELFGKFPKKLPHFEKESYEIAKSFGGIGFRFSICLVVRPTKSSCGWSPPLVWHEKIEEKNTAPDSKDFFFNLIFHFDHDHGAPVATMPKKKASQVDAKVWEMIVKIVQKVPTERA